VNKQSSGTSNIPDGSKIKIPLLKRMHKANRAAVLNETHIYYAECIEIGVPKDLFSSVVSLQQEKYFLL
jgi:hypothetical protein